MAITVIEFEKTYGFRIQTELFKVNEKALVV